MWASLPLASSPEHCLPPIQFLFIGSRLCSALLSGLTSRLGPCASLSLHLQLVVKRTCTSKLSNMLGTPNETPSGDAGGRFRERGNWGYRRVVKPDRGGSPVASSRARQQRAVPSCWAPA